MALSLDTIAKLRTSRGRRSTGAFLVEGFRAVDEVRKSSPGSILEILTVQEQAQGTVPEGARHLTAKQFRKICTTRTPQGIAAVVSSPREIYSADLPGTCRGSILLLEHVQDPGNVGTLIRTAAAFGWEGVILTGKTADPLAPKTVQATAGAVFSLWLRRTDRYLDMVDALCSRGYRLGAADAAARYEAGDIGPGPVILALGNEGAGLSADLLSAAAVRVRIPMDRRRIESLNVAVSGGILLYLLAGRDRSP